MRTSGGYFLNEWKNCFFEGCFFFSGLENRMNEWHVNFSAKKKQKKNARIWGKQKKTEQIFIKKNTRFPQNPNEWPMNFPVEKKNTFCFFSDQKYDFGKKKIFWFQWMDGLWTYPRKKNTVPLIANYKLLVSKQRECLVHCIQNFGH